MCGHELTHVCNGRVFTSGYGFLSIKYEKEFQYWIIFDEEGRYDIRGLKKKCSGIRGDHGWLN
jgi:hypothetical protein